MAQGFAINEDSNRSIAHVHFTLEVCCQYEVGFSCCREQLTWIWCDDVPSVLERLASFPTALPVSLQLSLLHDAFAMPSRCSPLKFFVPGASLLSLELPYCRWSFPTVAGASLLLLELPYCHWSFPDFRRASQSSAEFPSLLRSSPVFAGAPPCPPEFLLVCRSCCYSLRAPFPRSSSEILREASPVFGELSCCLL